MAKIGAVRLAAGSSMRFGADNKLLADIGGRPLIRSVAEAIKQRDIISEVVVVTGYDQPLIERALDGLRLRFINNPNWPKGMGSSDRDCRLRSRLKSRWCLHHSRRYTPFAGCAARATDRGVRSKAGSVDHSRDRLRRAAQSGFVGPRRFFALLTSLSGPEGGKRSLNTLAECAGAFALWATLNVRAPLTC
jgi:molybdenum cofactor cytidylyltransferase